MPSPRPSHLLRAVLLALQAGDAKRAVTAMDGPMRRLIITNAVAAADAR